MKLTQRDVDQLGPGEYRDDEVPGLVLRVRSTGHRAFALRYTLPSTGARKRLNLGPPTAEFSLTKARAETKKRLGGMYVGVDPARDLRPSQGPTVGEILDGYLERAKLSAATVKEGRRLAAGDLVRLRPRPAKDLKRSEIRAVGEVLAKRSGYIANRCHALLRSAFSWAVAQDILEATPFFKLPAPFDGELKSKRVLTPDELRALLFTLDELRRPSREVEYRNKAGEVKTRTETGGDHYADALLGLLLTGVRRRAMIEAEKGEVFHLDTTNGAAGENIAEWRVPPKHLKMRERDRANADPFVQPLSRQAAAVFRHRLEATRGSNMLFPRARVARSRGRAAAWWSSRWVGKLHARMSELLGVTVPAWKVHNLRHTLATHIEEHLKSPEAVTAGILGHSLGRGVTSRYALAQHLAAKREALQAWADWLDSLRRTSFKVAEGGRS
jgi:integrase